MIETVLHWGNTRDSVIHNRELLAGLHRRANWQASSDPSGAPRDSATLDLGTNRVYLSGGSEFTLLVSPTESYDELRAKGESFHNGTTAVINYHVSIEDALDIAGGTLKDWLLSRYRLAIISKLTSASFATAHRMHRDAREAMAEAAEMSCRLQSLEGRGLAATHAVIGAPQTWLAADARLDSDRLDRYRDAVCAKIASAVGATSISAHRDARAALAEAVELSCRLQSLEGDSRDGIPTATIGGMTIAIRAFDGAPPLVAAGRRGR